MLPNPALRRLGYSNQDRVVIIHADDIGMCQASVEAYADLFACGGITSGAVMVPCSWFPAAAALQTRFPKADLGVHLTLTSEWRSYRWGAISTRDPKSGLLDDLGYFPATSQQVQTNADPGYVFTEMAAQVNRAIQAGINPTHIDTHMGTVAHPKFMLDYLHLAVQNRIPAMMFRMDEKGWLEAGVDSDTAKQASLLIQSLEAQSVPLLDHLRSMPLKSPNDRFETAKQIFSDLPSGITHFIIHPSKDSPELRAIADDWACRVEDYELFKTKQMQNFLKSEGIQLIGYHALAKIMPEKVIDF
ncbi:MAG: hypothetical protein CL609_13590 [Anaerolineaceae bacterium]|nr:hypothetical protein [Anaerolineaceae bacterium]